MVGLIFSLVAQVACAAPAGQTTADAARVQSAATPAPAGVAADSEAELVSRINAFAEGGGDETALRDFTSRPRVPLITSITRIRDGAEPDALIRVRVAFLFCRLGHSYPENRAVVLDAFRNPRKYEGFFEDEGVGMLAALIRGGDQDLLPVTFRAAKKSDGALSEGLSDLFVKNLRENPNAFLRELSRMNADTRRDVYRLIGYAARSPDGSAKLRALLSSIPPDAKEYAVAKEMLPFLDD
jgi:hypothetical protein